MYAWKGMREMSVFANKVTATNVGYCTVLQETGQTGRMPCQILLEDCVSQSQDETIPDAAPSSLNVGNNHCLKTALAKWSSSRVVICSIKPQVDATSLSS